MDAPHSQCAFCGQPTDHQHHLTGRHPDKTYLHPELTVGLCHQHHVLVHNDLRTLGIDVPTANDYDPIRLVAFALRRIAAFLGRFATYADNPMWQPLAAVLQAITHTLARHPQNGTPS